MEAMKGHQADPDLSTPDIDQGVSDRVHGGSSEISRTRCTGARDGFIEVPTMECHPSMEILEGAERMPTLLE